MKNLNWMKDGYFSHRGLHNKDFPENSIGAFLNAKKHNFHIELDVQITKDNHLVVVHDKELLRLTGKDINVLESNYEDIKDSKLHNTSFTIPLLKDVLDLLDNNTRLLIELKTSKKNNILVQEVITLLKQYDFTYAFLSFDPKIVHILKKKYPQEIRGFIRKIRHSKYRIINFLIRMIPVIKITKPDFIMHKKIDLPNKIINRLKKKIPILVYTCTSNEDLVEMKDTYTNAVFEGFIPKT